MMTMGSIQKIFIRLHHSQFLLLDSLLFVAIHLVTTIFALNLIYCSKFNIFLKLFVQTTPIAYPKVMIL